MSRVEVQRTTLSFLLTLSVVIPSQACASEVARITFEYGLDSATHPYGEVCGVILDQRIGNPLAGVAVFLKGTAQGALTAEDGTFLIRNIVAAKYKLCAQLVGYSGIIVENVEMAAGRGISFEITMEENPYPFCIMPKQTPVNPSRIETEIHFYQLSEQAEQPDSGRITVEVVKRQNEAPLEVFSVRVSGQRSMGLMDSSGVFRSGGLVPGVYSIFVNLAPYKSINLDSIEVRSGKTTEITFWLEDAYWK